MTQSQNARSTRALIRRLEERAEQIAVAMAMRAREVPVYAAYDDDTFLESALQHCRDHVDAFLIVGREARQLLGPELDFVRRQAILRARQGVPLEPLLHVYRMGHIAIHDAIVEAGGSSKAGMTAAIELTKRTMAHIDLITTTYTQSYLEAQHAMAMEAESLQRELIERALVGTSGPDGRDADEARALGFDPDRPYVAAVIVAVGADGPGEELAAVLAALKSGSGHFGRSAIGTLRGGEALALIPASHESASRARDQLAQTVTGRGAVAGGISLVCQGLADLRTAYTQARAMAGLAAAGTVISLEDLTPVRYLLLTADETARALVDPRIAAMLADDAAREGALARTLLAFLEADLSATAAAAVLYVHPNTVHYRLGRVADACGRDPRHVSDLLDLVAAIRLLDLVPEPLGVAAASVEGTRRDRPQPRRSREGRPA